MGFLLLLLVLASSDATPLSILFVGNSYTYYNDLPAMLTGAFIFLSTVYISTTDSALPPVVHDSLFSLDMKCVLNVCKQLYALADHAAP